MVQYSQLDENISQTYAERNRSRSLLMTIFPHRQSFTSSTPAWIRWMPLWHGLFYLSLILTTGVAIFDGAHTWQQTAVLIGLSLLLGLWYAVCVAVFPQFWQGHPLLTMGYLVVGWALWFELTELDPVFLFVLVGLYPQVFVLPPLPWKILGAFLLTALSAWRQVTILGWVGGNLFLTLAAAVSGILIAMFINAIIDQSQQRQRLIEELETTRTALASAERQAGIMDERQRLAHEIHDTLAQGFTSIVMHLEAAEASLPTELNTLQRHLDQARCTARENLVETRRLLQALQPAILDHASLPEALTHLATRWAEDSGISASVTITGTLHTLRPEIEVTLLRTAQEALANARKHARANQVTLTLSYMDGTVVLDIQDDGIGFDTERLCVSPIGQPTGGFGLKALRERITQLGGTFSIESAPGEGTTIAIALPAVSIQSPLSLAAVKEET
jgi:signal transduction histidine kinase